LEDTSAIAGGVYYRVTKEQYFGYLQAIFGNAQRILPNEEQAFTPPKELERELPYLSGHWLSTKEAIIHERPLAGNHMDSLSIRYHAFTVDIAMGRLERAIPVIRVTLDGKPLPEDLRGADIELQGTETICRISESRLFKIVSSSVYH